MGTTTFSSAHACSTSSQQSAKHVHHNCKLREHGCMLTKGKDICCVSRHGSELLSVPQRMRIRML